MLEKVTAAQWLGAGVLTVVGGVAKTLIDGLVELLKGRSAEKAEETSALAEWETAVAQGGSELLNHFRKEFKFLREQLGEANNRIAAQGDRLAAQGARLADADAKIAVLDAEHSRCEARVESLRGEIARLMAEPPAGY